MQSRAGSPPIRIYRPSGYDRALAAFYGLIDLIFIGSIVIGVAIGVLGGNPSESFRQPSGVPPVGPIVGALVWVALFIAYWVSRRAALDVSADGIRVVPFIGRAHTYRWERIAGFAVVGFYPYGAGHYGAGRWFIVEARLNDGGSIRLRATERPWNQADAVAHTCDELTAQRPGQASAAAPALEALAQPGDARAAPGWPGAVPGEVRGAAQSVAIDATPVPRRFGALHPWLTLVSQLTVFAFLTVGTAGALAQFVEFPADALPMLFSVLLLLLLLLLGLVAGIGSMGTEQWLRRRQPVAAAFAGEMAAQEPSFLRRLLRRSYGPAAATFGFLWLLIVFAGMVGDTRQTQAAGARSLTVQATGTPASGMIEGVSVVGRTTLLTVRLSVPVDGNATTTVHEPTPDGRGAIGQAIDLLLDPQDPGYAELPGAPFVGTMNWLAVAAWAVLFLVLALARANILWQLWRYRRSFDRGRQSGRGTI